MFFRFYVYSFLLLCVFFFIIMFKPQGCLHVLMGGYIGQILEFALQNVYFCTAALRIV